MAEKHQRDYSCYDQMSTEELEQFLRLDFQASKEGASDLEAILYLTNQLARRKGPFDWSTAWEQLQTQYLPDSDGRSLYEPEQADGDGIRSAKPEKHPGSWLHSIRRHFGVLVLAVVLCLLGGILAARAGGKDALDKLATWTDDTLVLWDKDSQTQSVPGAVEQVSYPSPPIEDLLPTWAPDGFVPGQPEQTESSDSVVLRMVVQSEARSYSVEVEQFLDIPDDTRLAQSTGSHLERYDSTNRVFSIYEETDALFATYFDGEFCISIRGALTMEEMKAVVDSIHAPVSMRNREWMQNYLAQSGRTLYYPKIPEELACDESKLWISDLGPPFEWVCWSSLYSRGDRFLGINVDWKPEGSSNYYEKDDGPVEEYVYHGITHYLFTNGDFTSVVWRAEDVEYSMVAPTGAFDMKAIIHSVYEPA